MASDKFKTLCKEEAYKNRLGKIITPDETITNNDNLSSIEITDSCISNNKIVGTAIAKTIKFITTEDYELVDKEIDTQIGVLYDDTTTEYINVGKYTINKESANNTSKKGEYNGLDKLKKLDATYICGIADLSKATIGDFWQDACNQVGLTPNETTFTNSNIVIGGNPFTNNETVKTVMQQVAEAGMYWVEIDDDTNKVKLNWFTNTIEETFTKNDYSSLEKNNTYGPINSLVVGLKDVEGENVARQDSASVTKVGENQFAIYDNYFLYSEELRNQAIDNLWNKIKGFTYVNYSLTTYTGKPYLKRGSKISIEENDGTTFETYVLNHTFTYDGAFKSVISANSITNGETTNKNLPESASSKFKKVELKVDKVEGEITAVVDKVEEIEVETTLSKQASGNPIIVTDAGPYKLESLKIEGKSYQETRSGANLLSKINSVSGATDNKDGTYSQTITELTTIHWFITDNPITIPNGEDFYLSFDAKVSSNQTKGINTIYCNDGTSNINGTAVTNPNLGVNYQRYVFKINALDIEKTLTRISTQQSTLDGATITYKDLMVSFNNVAYEQYGASPSPEYPSEIKNVEGVTNYLPYPYVDTTKTINGVTFTDNGDGSITVNGTATANASFKLYGVSNKQVPLENKYITCGVASNSLSIRVVNNTNNTYNVVTSTNINNLFAKVDNTTYKEGYYELVVYSGHTINNLIVKPMIIDDITETDYVPYGRWLEVKSIGKNLLNKNLIERNKAYSYGVIGSVPTESTHNTRATLSVKNAILIKPNTSYTLTIPNGYGVAIAQLESDFKSLGDTGWSTSNTYRLTTKSNARYVGFNFRKADNSVFTDDDWNNFINGDLQFELKEATEYDPYKENTALIDLNKRDLFDKDKFIQGTYDNKNAPFRIVAFGEMHLKGASITIKNLNTTKYKFSVGFSTLNTQSGNTNINESGWVTNDSYTITAINDGYLWLQVSKLDNSNITPSELLETDFKIYEGTETDDYYRLASIGDIKDTFKDGVLTQRIGKVVLDGSETYYLDTTKEITQVFTFNKNTIPNLAPYKKILSTHFKMGVEGDTEKISLTDTIYIAINKTTASTTEEFKNWLKEQYDAGTPVIVEYELATPIEHNLNYEILDLHEGYNNITTNDELEPNMEITYLTDSKMNAQYATKGELKIESEAINLKVEAKIDDEDLTSAEIIARINADKESEAVINADKISLKGKEINLTTDNVKITSNNAEIDEEGNMNVIGGTQEEPHFKVYREDNTAEVDITPNHIIMKNTNVESSKVMYLGDDGNYDEDLRVNNYDRQIVIPNGLFNEIYLEESGITSQYLATDSDGIHSSRINAKELMIDNNDILNRYGNLGINTKGGIGLNASGNTYIRTTLEDGKLYQLVGTPKGIMYQHHDGEKWNTLWGDSGWINVPLASGVSAGTLTGTPKYRKVINKVDIKGSFAFTKASGSLLLGTLPEGFRPPEQFYFFAPLSGTRIARFYITETGQIYCEWIYNINGGTAYTGSVAWTSFNVSFYTD